jgi:4-aminobutyrate aminotransferase-like enzyme
VLRHHAGADGPEFFCLYGHLSRESLTMVQPGQRVSAGDTIGTIGDHTVNGGWAPHVHVQLMTDRMGDESGNFEGAAEPSRWNVWTAIVPDPNLLLRLAPESFEPASPGDVDDMLQRRAEVLAPSLSISYRKRLHIVRGTGTYLFDHRGQGFLDCVNNVCHVGHANPRVVAALAGQAATLNTNTRYLHRTILDYAERLGALLPDPLSVVYLVNSGSEATELALRLARTVTGRHDVITLDWGYHGNTAAAIEVSPYKFNRKGGAGKAAHIHIAALPDPYRGTEPLQHYIDSVAAQAASARERNGQGPAAFIAESISGCGGQVVLADGYLAGAHAAARATGALCIADEVQVGFGRVGTAMWAFEEHGVIPDIVTLGKPIGNGHPLGAVVTTPAIAAAFANGMEYFNTFGGNPVSCAVGMAVLDEIETHELAANASATGSYLLDQLRSMQDRHECIGDVRGRGLYIGVDLVSDRATKAEATQLASDVVNHMRERGVLVSTDGPADNVLKIKPPIVFNHNDSDVLCSALDAALTAVAHGS